MLLMAWHGTAQHHTACPALPHPALPRPVLPRRVPAMCLKAVPCFAHTHAACLYALEVGSSSQLCSPIWEVKGNCFLHCAASLVLLIQYLPAAPTAVTSATLAAVAQGCCCGCGCSILWRQVLVPLLQQVPDSHVTSYRRPILVLRPVPTSPKSGSCNGPFGVHRSDPASRGGSGYVCQHSTQLWCHSKCPRWEPSACS